MAHKQHLHIIDQNAEQRAALARTGYAGAYHVEIYADAQEFLDANAREGFVLIHDAGPTSEVASLNQALAQQGRWYPIVGHSLQPAIERIVEAVRAGALSFAITPQSPEDLESIVKTVERDAEREGCARQAAATACANLARLSMRERQVLERLIHGDSNKAIARHLDISPRTVEIHRMKMLGKLGAKSSADAIRLRVEAGYSMLLAA
jgi:FixJ family two-component response regulator